MKNKKDSQVHSYLFMRTNFEEMFFIRTIPKEQLHNEGKLNEENRHSRAIIYFEYKKGLFCTKIEEKYFHPKLNALTTGHKGFRKPGSKINKMDKINQLTLQPILSRAGKNKVQLGFNRSYKKEKKKSN